MRSHFNSGPNYKHLSYPSHTISLSLQVSLLVCASLCLVCLLVAYAVRQTHMHTLSQTVSPQSNELLLCFVFSGADPLQSILVKGENWVRLRFCLCSLLWGMCWGVVEGIGAKTHQRGTQPELSESRGAQENSGPPKQNTFYGNGYIYLHGSQKNHGRMAF